MQTEQKPRKTDHSSFQMIMEEKSQNDRLTLCVGGKVFEASRQTLCFDSESMLSAYVLRHLHPGVPLWLDRDGGRFDFVLNYLRNGTLFLEDIPSLRGVREEAVYYGLAGLENLCDEKIAAFLSRRTEKREAQKQLLTELRSASNLLHIKGSAMSGIPLKTLWTEEPVFDLNVDF